MIAAALLALVTQIPEGDSGTGICYQRQDNVTVQTQPNLVNRTAGLGGAHGVGAYGPDGVLYEIGSECTPSHTEDMPQRPGPNAGTITQSWWDVYWTGIAADLYRCSVAFPAGRLIGMPPPVDPSWQLCTAPKFGCVPHPAPAPGSYNPRLFVCGGTTPVPTPPKTATPRISVTANRTPSKTPTHPVGCCDPIPPNICPGGVPPCHPSTPSPTIRFTSTNTPLRTNTQTVTQKASPTVTPGSVTSVPTASPTCPGPILITPRPTAPLPTVTPTSSGGWFTGCRVK